MLSVNNNYNAALALQNLNKTNNEMSEVQNRISTGQKVSSAKDNGAVFAIAEGLRNRSNTVGRIKDGISQTQSAISAGTAAGAKIGDVLKQMKTLATDAASDTIDSNQRAALNATFVQLRDSIATIVSGATINGTNFTDGSKTGGVNVLVSDVGGSGSQYKVQSNAAGLDEGADGAYTLLSRGQKLLDLVGDAGTTAGIDDGSLTAPETADRVEVKMGSGEIYNVTFSPGMTVNDYVNAFEQVTGGKVKASFDDATGQITYSSASAFSLQAVDGDGGGDLTDVAGQILIGANANTDAAAASAAGTSATTKTINGFNFNLGASGGALAGIASNAQLSSQGAAATMMTSIDTAITNLNKDAATLTGEGTGLKTQSDFLASLMDELDNAVSNLVDADLAKESARLQSLQVRQQLGAQALSIANQSPQVLLSFFRG